MFIVEQTKNYAHAEGHLFHCLRVNTIVQEECKYDVAWRVSDTGDLYLSSENDRFKVTQVFVESEYHTNLRFFTVLLLLVLTIVVCMLLLKHATVQYSGFLFYCIILATMQIPLLSIYLREVKTICEDGRSLPVPDLGIVLGTDGLILAAFERNATTFECIEATFTPFTLGYWFYGCFLIVLNVIAGDVFASVIAPCVRDRITNCKYRRVATI
jgi:hypothetical protein